MKQWFLQIRSDGVSPESSGWKELARINGILRKGKYDQGYPHVALSNGRIVCKNIEGDVVCLYLTAMNDNTIR